MPNKKPDATEEAAVTPGTDDEGQRVTDGDSSLPPAGAESEPTVAARAEEPAEPDQTVTVDEGFQPEPEPEVATEATREDYAEDGHEGMSFAAWALTILLLLLAGAALGIWGAPRVAPMLPSGLAPVADWLTPGRGQAEAEVAALRAHVDEEFDKVDSRLANVPGPDDIDSRISSAVGNVDTRLSAEIGALQETTDQIDGAEIRSRLGKLESTLDGQSAELTTLKDQLSGTVATSGQISSDAAKKIDVYKAELDGVRAEMAALRDSVGALDARVEQVSANADRQIQAAQSKVSEVQSQADSALGAAEIEADVAQIRAAIIAGQPFEEPLGKLESQPNLTVPDGLKAAASSGVVTMATLRDRFPDAAHDAIQASIMASAGSGVLARSKAFLEAQMASRSLTPQQGMTPDAILSRMEDRLNHDDLKGVLAEAQHLPSEAAAAMSGWLDSARQLGSAVEGLAALDAAAPATN